MASLTTAAASSSSSSLPCSSPNHQNHYTYEVFLSFRGEDTRFNFTDHLHSRLCERGIETFIDDELRRGEEISAALVKAIEESRVSIIVFSQNYASSRWCLDELVKILECRKSKGQEVRVLFYKVDPSDVRHQSGAFGDAFATLDQCKYEDSMGKWKAALNEAADLSGWPFKDGESEAKFIKKIIDELSARVVNPSCELHVTEHPIGLESCRQDVNRLLHVEEDIVRMVGIWGPGGIGKTTIVKDVFNSIRHKFEGSCFLADVRSKSSDLAQLQETLLFDLLRDRELKVCNVDVGVSLIKTRMRNKKVFLILDDVSHFSQLQNLIPSPDCFGPGSRILITTRDKRWLIAHQVDDVYEVKMLNDRQAMNLFSLNAFKRNRPPGDYLKLAQCAVCYAQGLPLALIVLGSHLFGRSREEWEATLDSCRGEDPHREIRDVLKISYDALGEDLKGYFLDIACFFKDEEVDHVKPILDACYDVKSVNGIAQLQEKALIRIDKDWKGCRIWMHDLIEEMGKDIVYQESPDEPGERSRVWNEEDVNDILTNNTGTNKVIGIQVPWLSSTTSLNAKSFSGMTKLRYISMRGMMKYESFSRDIDYLSNQLRWLDWPKCPLQCFPSDFHANKLVYLDISYSCRITRLWKGHKKFPRLACMNLRGCESLEELPDFSGIPNLKELDLSRCTSLVEVPDSIRFLHNLVALDVHHCSNLIMFPRKVNLKSVETISISYCKLEEFSEVGEEMVSLRSLNLSGTCIKELHSSITQLIGLEVLKLRDCKNLTTLPDNIYKLHNLKTLDATGCSKLVTFPKVPVKMDSLRRLSLNGSDIRELDESIENLIGLEELGLTNCKNLTTLPCSIYGLHNLKSLQVSGCSKLATFPKIPVKMDSLRRLSLKGSEIRELDESIENLIGLEELDLTDCKNLTTLSCNIYGLHNLKSLQVSGCSKLATFSKIPVKMHSFRRFYLKGSDIRELDESIENLIGLEELDLTDCKNLTTLSCNIYGLHNLKSLQVSGCSKLATFPKIPVKMDSLRLLSLKGSDIRELDESIENLIGLEELYLTDCKNLSTLPCSIYGLHNLKSLEASGCSKLATFPKILIKMDSLRLLSLKGSDIKELDESIENLIGLEYLDLTYCKNLVALPCSIYGLQNLWFLDLGECSKLVKFPTNTKILNVDGCSLSLPKLGVFSIAGCSLLSDCDFLTTLDCWETLQWLNLSRNNFVSLPACLTKFVRLRDLNLYGCKRLRGIPELPPNVKPYTRGCESLEERSSTLTDPGAVIEAASPSIEEPTPSTEEPSPIPMIPDLQTHHVGWHDWRSYILSANDDYQEQQEHVSITELVRNFNTTRNQLSC